MQRNDIIDSILRIYLYSGFDTVTIFSLKILMTSCPAGFGLVSGSCLQCLPGTYSLGGLLAKCSLVPAGFYNSSFGSEKYSECKFSILAGAANCRNNGSMSMECFELKLILCVQIIRNEQLPIWSIF